MPHAAPPPLASLMQHQSPQHLSDAELLAVVAFRGSNKRAAGHARRLLGQNSFATFYRVHQMAGLDAPSVARVEAAMELARRIQSPQRGDTLERPADVTEYLLTHYRGHKHEVFGVVFLDQKLRVITLQELFSGSSTGAFVSANELARRCIQHNAKSVILFHNHPSGNAQPSQDDIDLTRHLDQALRLLEIDVLDHIVVGDTTFSFLNNHLMP